MNLNSPLINIAGFQLGWFSCVIGAAHGMPWLGPIVALPIIAWHLLNACDIHTEFKFLLLASLLGILFDQALLWTGLLKFAPAASWPANILPGWMMTLWLLFNTTLNVSLRWLRKRTFLAMALGLVGGPLAYLSAAELGAIFIVDQPLLILVLALGWALHMPALLHLSSRFDGYEGSQTSKMQLQDV